MYLRTIINSTVAFLVAFLAPYELPAQEHPARRLSSIVGVAVEEYGKGVDDRGRLTSEMEYQEAVDFLRDARLVAERLSGDQAGSVKDALDSLIGAVSARRPQSDVARLHQRFVAALGTEGALELPSKPLSTAAGRALYDRSCASCHGASGLGDGPAARGMVPAPPAVGSAAAMSDVTPALLFRVISVGIPGTQMPGWASTLSVQDRWNIVAYLHSLRTTQAGLLEGEGLLIQQCASCHGATGLADGTAARALTRLPPEIGAFTWQVEQSDAEIALAIRNGIPGSAMPPARDLSDAELAKIVAYLRSVPVRRGEIPASATSTSDTSGAAISRLVLSTLDQSLAAAHSGRLDDASDRAFDAYIAFEPLESSARARNPGLVATMERHFAEFKAAVRANELRSAQGSRDAIESGLPEIVALTERASGTWGAFLQSFLIILREGFEAILVLGAIITFLIKTGNRERLRSIWLGAGIALAASAITAVVLQTALRAMPATREIIEGITMLVAVAVLFSVSYWLISRVEAARWQQFIRDKVDDALQRGGGKALAFVAFLAVYREGAETALFYQALFGEGRNVIVPITLGILVGFVALAVIFTLFYRFGVRIPLRPFFAATSVLLYYMAFVFMGKGIRELQEGNVISITMIPGFPQSDALGIYATVETLSAQLLLVLLFGFALLKTFWPRRAVTLPTVPPPPVTPAGGDNAARITALQDALARFDERLSSMERGATVDAASIVGEKHEERE
ncbi:MAG: FTR1 family protein [Gemmatimonadaceae bacterium]